MTDNENTIDERIDALDRFERTINTQLALLSKIDDKAANVVRYTSLLIGVLFTALTLAAQSKSLSLHDVAPLPSALFFVGTTSLLVAICVAIITYLSSVQEYGPDASYGYNVAGGDIQTPDYEMLLLVGYADAVKDNMDVIDANALRFRWALSSLLVGVVYTSLAGGIVVHDLPASAEWVISTVVTAFVGFVVYKIYAEDFLVLERG